MKKVIMMVIIIIVAVGADLVILPTTPVPLPSPMEISDSGIDLVASGLKAPWAIDFTSDGRIFFTERIGNVRVIENDKLITQPVFTTEVAMISETGMLGLALDPDFDINHFIYIYYTYVDINDNLWNNVVRLKEQNKNIIEEKVLLDKIPGAPTHDGGRIKFGPDCKLYITTGDAANPILSQDLDSLAGKILRINSDGSIPDDNPFPNSPVYSYGHRNPQGIAWHPTTKELYSTEQGPIGNDEINIIKAGMNYGWPIEQCVAKEFIEPFICYEVNITPAGATFYSSDRLPYKNDLFFATLRNKHVEHLIFDNDYRKAENFLDGFGRIRDIAEGPDGYLYIATSNGDERGFPIFGDDKILRISKAR